MSFFKNTFSAIVKANWKRITWWVLFISLLVSIALLICSAVSAPETNSGIAYERERSDYVMPLVQCTLGLIVMFLPQLIERRWSVDIPNYMQIIYFVFLYCAVYLGEVRNFYFVIPYWDIILHSLSGIMLAAFGFFLVTILNDSPNVQMKLSPLFVSLFAFCFALAMGAIWEMYEFLCDSLLDTNMQKFMTEDRVILIGQEALRDTMEDFVTDAASAFVISAVGFCSLKKRQRKHQPAETANGTIYSEEPYAKSASAKDLHIS